VVRRRVGSVRVTVKRTVTVSQRRTVQRRMTSSQQVRSTNQLRSSTSSRALPPAGQAQMLRDDGYGPIPDVEREFDLFLSHATEDKDFVRPLAAALASRGVRVWFDETAISIGDSLRESIDMGLRRSRFGVVVLSHSFFAKRWPNYELNGLVSREMKGRKVILPVLHPSLSHDELVELNPTLADKKALIGSQLAIGDIADELHQLIIGA
jgi:TIR domain